MVEVGLELLYCFFTGFSCVNNIAFPFKDLFEGFVDCRVVLNDQDALPLKSPPLFSFGMRLTVKVEPQPRVF